LINDEWGHEIGDAVLVRIGELLLDRSRAIDVAARFGGEEFVVLLPGCTSSEAEVFADRVRGALASAGATGLPTVRMSAGVFVDVAPGDIDAMVQRADSALYDAKRAGRDRTAVFGRSDRPAAPILHQHARAQP